MYFPFQNVLLSVGRDFFVHLRNEQVATDAVRISNAVFTEK